MDTQINSKDKDKVKGKENKSKNISQIDNCHLGEPKTGNFAELTRALIKPIHQESWNQLQHLWESRCRGWRLSTTGYQAAQFRMLPFLIFPPKDRSEIFLTVLGKSGILFGSGATYWTALSTLEGALQVPPAPDRTKIQKYLETKGMAEVPSRISCTRSEVEAWTHCLPTYLRPALISCFILGQRLSDFLLLTPQSYAIIRTKTEAYGVLTFYEGKVVGITGPYSIHVDLNSGTHQQLLLAVKNARTLGWNRLFVPPTNTTEEQRAIIHLCIERDVRCIRRGGLQLMALSGLPLSTILLFSRHRTPEMLSRYLEHNRFLFHQARLTSAAVESSENNWDDSGHIELL